MQHNICLPLCSMVLLATALYKLNLVVLSGEVANFTEGEKSEAFALLDDKV